MINVDLFPDVSRRGRRADPDGKVLDGESLLPLLKGEGALKRQAIFWHFPGYLDSPVIRGRELDVRTGFRTRPVSVIRKGDWKLHLYHEEWQLDGGREKLGDQPRRRTLQPGRRHRRTATTWPTANPAKRDELLDDLLAWFKSTDALLPTQPNPKYDPGAATTKGKKGRKQTE